MTKEKWGIVLENIERKFEILDRGIDEGYGQRTEWIEFENPQGKMRLEWIEKPRMTGFKTAYSKRLGTSAGKVEQTESKSEKVNFVRAYIFSEEKNDWEEMKADALLG